MLLDRISSILAALRQDLGYFIFRRIIHKYHPTDSPVTDSGLLSSLPRRRRATRTSPATLINLSVFSMQKTVNKIFPGGDGAAGRERERETVLHSSQGVAVAVAVVNRPMSPPLPGLRTEENEFVIASFVSDVKKWRGEEGGGHAMRVR